MSLNKQNSTLKRWLDLTFKRLVKQKDQDHINLSCLASAVVTPTPHTVSMQPKQHCNYLLLGWFRHTWAHDVPTTASSPCRSCLDHLHSSALIDTHMRTVCQRRNTVNVTVPLSRPHQHRSLLSPPAANLDGAVFSRHQFRLSRGVLKTKNVTRCKERFYWFYKINK